MLATVLLLVVSGLAAVGVASAPSVSGSSSLATASGSYSWTQLYPSTLPTTRDQLQMTYDPALKEVVLFGGYDPHVHPDGDTWVYQSAAWTNITPTLKTSPAARWGGSLAYDPTLKAVVLFGGRDLTRFFSDTWYFDAKGWHHVTTTTHPSERSGASMAFDPVDHYLLLFGGGKGNLPAGSESPWTYYNDTWKFSGGAWHKLRTAPFAPTDAMHFLYDPVDHYMMAEGGAQLTSPTSSVLLNETWSYVGGSWMPIRTSGAPPTMAAEGCIAWDDQTGSAILFGGEYGVPEINTTWSYVGGVWTNLTGSLSVSPPVRAACGLAYDAASHYLFLFGGDTVAPNYTYYNDNWEFT